MEHRAAGEGESELLPTTERKRQRQKTKRKLTRMIQVLNVFTGPGGDEQVTFCQAFS